MAKPCGWCGHNKASHHPTENERGFWRGTEVSPPRRCQKGGCTCLGWTTEPHHDNDQTEEEAWGLVAQRGVQG